MLPVSGAEQFCDSDANELGKYPLAIDHRAWFSGWISHLRSSQEASCFSGDVLITTNEGLLYGINGFDDSLYSISTVTGQATLIGPTGHQLAWGFFHSSITRHLLPMHHWHQSTRAAAIATNTAAAASLSSVGLGCCCRNQHHRQKQDAIPPISSHRHT